MRQAENAVTMRRQNITLPERRKGLSARFIDTSVEPLLIQIPPVAYVHLLSILVDWFTTPTAGFVFAVHHVFQRLNFCVLARS